jgi:hypothetical protein
MTNLQDITNTFLQDGMPVNIKSPSELCPVLIPEVHPDEVVFEPRVLTDDTVRLSNIRSFEHHPRRGEGDVVTQERSFSSHLPCEGIKKRLFRRHHNPVDALVNGFILWSTLQLLDEVLQDLSDGMMRIDTFLVILEPFVQRRQAIRVDVNDIANVQEVVPKQGLELKRDLPIRVGPAEKFRQAVDLGLCEEVAGLDFDFHLCGTCETSPLTEILDLETGFVFVEVEDDWVNVWRHTSVGRT